MAETAGQTKKSISAALDQWRGLAMLLVLLNHGFKHTGHVEGLGRAGVNLFFFISGLLTYRSLRGIQRSQQPMFKELYRRRFLRLVPAMFIYLLLISSLALVTDLSVSWKEVGASACWVRNYFSGGVETHHLWSTSCEMQFYLLAPMLFLLIGAQRPILKAGFYILLLIAFIGGLISLLYFSGQINFRLSETKYTFEYSAWPMILGFLCEHHHQRIKKQVLMLERFAVPIGIGTLIAMAVVSFAGKTYLSVALGMLLIPACGLMYLSSEQFSGLRGEILEWFGFRTYSIYLWQQLFTLGQFQPMGQPYLGIIPAVVLGAISFSFVEMRFMRRQIPK